MRLQSTAPTLITLNESSVRETDEGGVPHLRLVESSPVPILCQNPIGRVGNTLLGMSWPIWGFFDMAILAVGIYLSYGLFVWSPEGRWVRFGWVETCLIQCGLLVLMGMVFGLYEQQTLLRRSRILARSLLTIGSAVAVTYIVISLLMYEVHSRRVLFLAAGLYLLVALPVRLLVCLCLDHHHRKFVILGTDRKSQMIPAGMGDGLSKRYQLAGFVAVDPMEVGREIKGRRVLGAINDIERICLEHRVNEVVVGPVLARNPRLLDKALACLRLGCRVTNLSTFYEQILSQVPVDHLEPHWFLFADLKHYREAQLIMKRAFDIFGAVLGLLLSLPIWPLIALLIKMDLTGPIFYHQCRVGLNGRHFWLHKFRTMHPGAERNGCVWASEDDPRVTRVGRFLRKTRLDELPQLWNILLGQMSVVGPRPERPEFVRELDELIPFYNERHLIKPGLTGWAQINYRYGSSVDDSRRKLELDLWYLKHMSLELDLIIILRTLGTVFLGSR
ncbi:MAG: sugar transferase [Phycisphaerales bacterium]|nr:sugar transferase [Phycisphaerales bacterium]